MKSSVLLSTGIIKFYQATQFQTLTHLVHHIGVIFNDQNMAEFRFAKIKVALGLLERLF